MLYDGEMQSEAPAGRKRLKLGYMLIAGQARGLSPALWAGDPHSAADRSGSGRTAPEGIDLLFMVDIGQYRRISAFLGSGERHESRFGAFRPDWSCSEVIREWRQKGI